MIMAKSNGGPIRPAIATSAPVGPRKRDPKITEKLRMLPPGRMAHSAYASLNCSGVSHLRSSTIMRRDQASTPPKPDSEMVAKAMNSSASVGRTGCGAGAGAGGGAAAGVAVEPGIGGEVMKFVYRPRADP